jgi:hypothetical protein
MIFAGFAYEKVITSTVAFRAYKTETKAAKCRRD